MTSDPTYRCAATATEALAMAVEAGSRARFLAGGTAVRPAAALAPSPDILIDIMRLDCGPPVEAFGMGLRMAATVRLEALRGHEMVRRLAPTLAAALGGIAATGIRTQATLGGNIAWGQGDLVPLLLVLDARVVLAAQQATLPLADYLRCAPRPLLTAVLIDEPEPPGVFFRKIAARAAFGSSLLTIAAARSGAGWHVAIGSGCVRPQVLPVAITRDLDGFDLPDDIAATAAYRRRVLANVVTPILEGTP